MHDGCHTDSTAQVWFARYNMPLDVRIFLIPANGCLSLSDALFQSDGVYNFRTRFTTLAPGCAKRMQFAGTQCVLQAEIDRVQAEIADDVLDLPFERPKSLRNPVTAERSGWRGIGIHHIGIEANIGR